MLQDQLRESLGGQRAVRAQFLTLGLQCLRGELSLMVSGVGTQHQLVPPVDVRCSTLPGGGRHWGCAWIVTASCLFQVTLSLYAYAQNGTPRLLGPATVPVTGYHASLPW